MTIVTMSSELSVEQESFDSPRGEMAWLADLVYVNGRFERSLALVCDRRGRVVQLTRSLPDGVHVVRLRGRVILPGLVNAHSHAFHRALRARTERRTAERDSFWTWREMMYELAARLGPEELRAISRMAFLEMALGGVSTVGEFHYLHHAPEGTPYDEPVLLAKVVIRAALDVGLRVSLLHALYMRAGFDRALDKRQRRFVHEDVETYFEGVKALRREFRDEERVRVGVAPHSVRAVPREALREVAKFAAHERLPVHMHVAEQPAEIEACLQEYGHTPVRLLAEEGMLNERFTAIHAIHIDEDEARLLGEAKAHVCACPTTERNLGDGIVAADTLLRHGARIALGTDSHAQIDLFEDARELELNLRLKRLGRALLAPAMKDERNSAIGSGGGDESEGESLATRLFAAATENGASSLGCEAGRLAAGAWADFFTMDLNDPAIVGADDSSLLAHIVFAAGRSAVRDVVVGGKMIVRDGKHEAQDEIAAEFAALQKRLWS
ncbi:formimidoylglutamate deiminase [Pyrinomonas methylaliphatogenes]|nr:formimidoylglutamate deiminase [Pyrinomonas methylaliphatogenes]